MMTSYPRSVVTVAFLVACFLFLLMVGMQMDSLAFGGNYVYQVCRMIGWDEERAVTIKNKLLAEDEWNLHKMNMKYYKAECSESQTKPRYAWITALNNDKYVIPTLVLGHLLDRLSCLQNKVVLVSSKVSQLGIDALKSIGFQVEITEGLDCNYMDRVYGRAEANKGITGTHTRLQIFNMTQYDKVIYLDSDYFPTTPLDSLFDEVWPGKLTAAYCSKPGVVDPCFNAGLSGLVPNAEIYSLIMEYWKSLSADGCPDDQRLLWYYFANSDNWIPISYSYNVRRERYYPMKSFHFAGHGREPRPWDWKDRPSPEELVKYDKPMATVMDIISLWWKYLHIVIKEKNLEEFWQSVRHLTI